MQGLMVSLATKSSFLDLIAVRMTFGLLTGHCIQINVGPRIGARNALATSAAPPSLNVLSLVPERGWSLGTRLLLIQRSYCRL